MPEKYRVQVALSAQNDLDAIWDYISPTNPLNVLRFIDELEEKVLSLSTLPERHPVIPEGELLQTSLYRHLVHKHYRIVYRIGSRVVYVLRIFHGAKLLDLASLD